MSDELETGHRALTDFEGVLQGCYFCGEEFELESLDDECPTINGFRACPDCHDEAEADPQAFFEEYEECFEDLDMGEDEVLDPLGDD